MVNTLKITHIVVVNIFLLIYLVKTILLLADKKEQLEKFKKISKVPEMIVSFLFLATGIYLLTQIPSVGTLLIVKIIIVFASIPVAIVGFKKENKVLASLAMLMIIGAYGLAEMNKKQAAVSTDKVNGSEIYTTSCVRCHGDNGKAGVMGATDLSMSQLDDAATAAMITTGKGSMPAFGGQLNDQQITAVSQYVKTLRK